MVALQVYQIFLVYIYLIAITFILQYFSNLNYDMLQTSRTEIISIFQRLSISADFIKISTKKSRKFLKILKNFKILNLSMRKASISHQVIDNCMKVRESKWYHLLTFIEINWPDMYCSNLCNVVNVIFSALALSWFPRLEFPPWTWMVSRSQIQEGHFKLLWTMLQHELLSSWLQPCKNSFLSYCFFIYFLLKTTILFQTQYSLGIHLWKLSVKY